MLDFSSSLYLGIDHASHTLRPWSRLTTGKPGLLYKPPRQKWVEDKLAELMGYEQTLLGTSTLHLFWDVFGMLSKMKVVIYVDKHAYPVSQWGVERAACRGITIRQYTHHNDELLYRQISRDCKSGYKPVVVTDGFCPGCGRFAPVKQLLTIVRKNGGYVLLDDTQALGIFGRHEKTGNVFGTGGGGTLQRQQIIDPHVVCISSMAKGLGVPVAVLAGSRQFLKQFAETSETLTHSSPPSNAVISAAEHALQVNQSDGERIRFRLSKRIGYFKQLLSDIGLSTHQSCFPLQTLKVLPQLNSRKIYTNLLQQGVQTVLHRVRCTGKICVSFIITAKHSIAQLHQAALKLAHIVGSTATRKNREFNNEYYGFGY